MLTLDTLLKTRATSQYTNFDFNSMVKFGDSYLGASSAGLFALDGNDDNGTDIDAHFEPITTDFGMDNPKRARFVYLGYEADGNLAVTVNFDDGTTTSRTYDSTKTGQQRRRKSFSRNRKGRYCKVKVANVDGCDFSIDSIELLLIILTQGYN